MRRRPIAVPAGTAAGLGVLSSYLVLLMLDLDLVEARTGRRHPHPRRALPDRRRGRRPVRATAVLLLCLGLLALYKVVLAIPSLGEFFDGVSGPAVT